MAGNFRTRVLFPYRKPRLSPLQHGGTFDGCGLEWGAVGRLDAGAGTLTQFLGLRLDAGYAGNLLSELERGCRRSTTLLRHPVWKRDGRLSGNRSRDRPMEIGRAH